MTIHYHGGPISGPETCAFEAYDRGHAFVSFRAPDQLPLIGAVAESFAIDNGAFSIWRQTGQAPDSWDDYYKWAGEVLLHPACDWAVIPDVIGGTEAENDALLDEWPWGHRGVPVWHLNESIDRLEELASQGWPRIALGSAAEYDVSNVGACLDRLADALPAICDAEGRPLVKLHGLRMLRPDVLTQVPLASADSTNLARNPGLDGSWRGPYAPRTKETRVRVLRERIESFHSPDRLVGRDRQGWFELEFFAAEIGELVGVTRSYNEES